VGASPPQTSTDCYTIVRQAPLVAAISRVGSSPTSASSVMFLVTFSEEVQGVDATDFVTHVTGTIASAVVTAVSGAGNEYSVQIGVGPGNGGLQLSSSTMTASSTSMVTR